MRLGKSFFKAVSFHPYSWYPVQALCLNFPSLFRIWISICHNFCVHCGFAQARFNLISAYFSCSPDFITIGSPGGEFRKVHTPKTFMVRNVSPWVARAFYRIVLGVLDPTNPKILNGAFSCQKLFFYFLCFGGTIKMEAVRTAVLSCACNNCC